MGNQASENQSQEYQRMGNGRANNAGLTKIRQGGSNRQQSNKQSQMNLDGALDTLQSMFLSMDREVLRLVLIEQCGGNMDVAVETLLSMQAAPTYPQGGTQAVESTITNKSSKNVQSPQSPSSPSSPSSELILYDGNMRPITVSTDFLQPPSYYLSTCYGLSAAQIQNLQIQQQAQNEVARQLALNKNKSPVSSSRSICIDVSIVGQWTNLMKRYKFKSSAEMARKCQMECSELTRCGSFVRVIFMMKLYQRVCNESGDKMNEQAGELMHEYLNRGFKEYSLIQLINDCNHLMQYHQFGGEHLKNMVDVAQRSLMRNQMREYFGHCDVMNCKVLYCGFAFHLTRNQNQI